jgi:hypothetical protein
MIAPHKINLLPQEFRNREASQKATAAYVTALIIGAVIAGGGWWGMGQYYQIQESELTNLQASQSQVSASTTVTPTLSQVDSAQRITALNTLAKQEVNWSKVFSLVSSITAKDVTISTGSLGNSSSGVVWRCTGSAPSAMAFAGYVQAMNASTDITSVKVEAFAYSVVTGRVDFTISAIIPTSSVIYSSLQ